VYSKIFEVRKTEANVRNLTEILILRKLSLNLNQRFKLDEIFTACKHHYFLTDIKISESKLKNSIFHRILTFEGSRISNQSYRWVLVYKPGHLEFFKMNRDSEIIQIEEFLGGFFENLNDDISFTSEEITAFHANWRRLNELERLPQRSSGVYLIVILGLIMIGFIFKCFVLTA